MEKRMVFTEPQEQGQAKQKRDRVARLFRKEGWTVKVETVSFSDLGRGASYILTASRPETSGQVAYRGYLIAWGPMNPGFYFIKKDGFNIGSGSSLEEAKKAVDEVVG